VPARGAQSFGECSVFVRCLFGLCSDYTEISIRSYWEALVDGQFQDILDSLPEKPPHSRLEPYRQLIDELRRRGRTFREIAHILREKCHVETAASTIHDFVRVRSRRERQPPRRPFQDTTKRTPLAPTQGMETGTPAAKADAAADEVRRKIAALKARKFAIEPTPEGFHFDPSEPLRLKKLGKK
jgi:hypothetical protein